MNVRIALAAGALAVGLRLAWASGCFGGSPDIAPRNASAGIPSNAHVTIARRSPASVSWFGPDRRPIAFREQRIGSGPSAARILVGEAALPAGVHTLRLQDPDITQTFRVVPDADSLPPELDGELQLEAINAPEPSGECPENIFIRARFRVPQDDRTSANDFTYFVWVQPANAKQSSEPQLAVVAESVSGNVAGFGFGETGCGCIPRFSLAPGTTYSVTVRAVDLAGHPSARSLSASVTLP